MSNYNWIIGALLSLLGLWSIFQLNRRRDSDIVFLGFKRDKDVKFVGGIILPFSLVISTVLFYVTCESWTLANVVTVYGGIFGLLATGYCVWKM